MQRLVLWVAMVATGAGVAAQAPAVAPAAPGAETVTTIRLLTIGNSFSGNATRYLGQIAASVPGCRIEIGRADIGGCPLDKHWTLAEKSERDPACKPYTRGDKTYNLKEMLQLRPWDVVTLQQASPKSFVEESYQPYADRLYQYVRQHAPQAKVVIHQTWAYGDGNERLKQWTMTPTQMQDGVVACYDKLSAHLGCPLLPSGRAFWLARQQRPELGLFAADLYHAGDRGCYLVGCVWFGGLFGISPEKVAFAPKGMAEEEALFLRRTAAAALAANAAPAAAH